jgi:hypothetical protein
MTSKQDAAASLNWLFTTTASHAAFQAHAAAQALWSAAHAHLLAALAGMVQVPMVVPARLATTVAGTDTSKDAAALLSV